MTYHAHIYHDLDLPCSSVPWLGFTIGSVLHFSQMSVGAAGHASGCWRSELGAGVPYNREKNENQIYLFLAVAHF